MLSCMRRSVAGRCREEILLLSLAIVTLYLECIAQCFQKRFTKVIRGLEHMACVGRLTDEFGVRKKG